MKGESITNTDSMNTTNDERIAALRAAIEEGEASGYVENFDFEAHLKELKAKRKNNGILTLED